MIKYKCNNWEVKITKVEVERETDKCVWINGRRNSKESEYDNFFDTFEEAKEFIIGFGERKVAQAKKRLERANEYLSLANQMQKQKRQTGEK